MRAVSFCLRAEALLQPSVHWAAAHVRGLRVRVVLAQRPPLDSSSAIPPIEFRIDSIYTTFNVVLLLSLALCGYVPGAREMQLLERASQLTALNSALVEVTAGEGCVALVYGEAGIGKTSLVDQFVKANAESWRVLFGACDLLFTPRPLGPLGDVALQTQGRLLQSLESGAQREVLFPTCLTELQDRPTILVIEDIHWADEATLDLLKYLGRRIRQTCCLLILTYRDDEIGQDAPLRSLLGDFAASQACRRIQVPALSPDGVRELLDGRALDPVRLHRLTNGNPFFLTEILAGQGGIPQTVRDALLARAARLSPSARRALEAAAVAGLHIEAWLLMEMLGPDCGGLEECVARGLLQQQGDGYAFRHDLARQTILECLSLTRKREVNRLALAALSRHPQTRGDLARLASHAEGTDDAQAVLEYAPAAARQAAAAGAHGQAVALYELAIKYADALSPSEHVVLLEAYADERWYKGWHETMIPLRRQVIERYHALGDRLHEGRNLAMLASELHHTADNAEVQRASQAAITILEALPAGAELAQAYRQRSYLLSEGLHYEEGVEAGFKAIALAERIGEMDTLSRACNITAQPLLWMGDERGRALMQRSLSVAREHGLQYAVGLALAQWAGTLTFNSEFEEASRLVQECIAYTTEHDDDNHLSSMPMCQAYIHLCQGRWTEVAEVFEQARHRHWFGNIETDATFVLGRLGVRRGDAGAQQMLQAALAEYMRTNSLEGIGGIYAGLAEAAWLAGDSTRAIEEARAAYDLFASHHIVWPTGELAFWRWRAGDVFIPPDWIASPYALQIAGEWRAAEHEWEMRGCPYERGVALMDGDHDAQLEALEIFERLGARPIIEKIKRQMRARGVRGIPRGPRPATRQHRFGLTAREMDVLACLVEGSSNSVISARLSLSVRTVEHHITSMLQKTCTGSRGELVALALKESLLVHS